MHEMTNWVIGYYQPFHFSKDRCQKFLLALLASGGRINDCDSFSFKIMSRNLYGDIKPHQVEGCFSISIIKNLEPVFDKYMGENIREVPPEMIVN